MKFVEYNPVEEKGNCILRSITKVLDEDYVKIKEEILELTDKLGYSDYREIEVFESYLKSHNIEEIASEEIQIKDLKLDNGKYVIFCYDKKDFYHMTTIIDNTLYDKNNGSLDLYVLKIYTYKK